MAAAAAAALVDNEFRAEQVFKQLEDIGAKVFFEKQLTSSDVSASGRVVVPKAIAEQYFPRIDTPSGTELSVEDAAGDTYTLRFRFWINNQSRMYLLEGTAELQHHYHLKMGDVLIFAQKEDSTIVLAGRPPTKADAHKKPPVRRPSPTPAGRGAARRDQPRGAKDRNKRRALQRFGLSGDDVEPPVDGVFRALPAESSSSTLQEGASSVAQAKDGRWVAALNLGGELYQAFFVQQDDALEALNAAGYAAQVSS
uniref:TF-B3 domain-containing protein n=1 Tax=Tetradesmus obliquus TaxID=3088 RepID=A0A383W833_TETOB|eukprot:jgi/Sobl393_1/3268/SZX73788.1